MVLMICSTAGAAVMRTVSYKFASKNPTCTRCPLSSVCSLLILYHKLTGDLVPEAIWAR